MIVPIKISIYCTGLRC